MDDAQWSVVDDYLCRTLVPADAALDGALRRSAEAGLPAINVAPNQGKFLHLLARIRGARRILEVGTLGGYSTIWLGRALPPGGELVTLEVDENHARVARESLREAGLSDYVSIVVGPAVSTLERMVAEGTQPFDLIFIDADKKSNPDYLAFSLKLSAPGTVIVCDNVVRGGRVVDADTTDPDVRGIRTFLSRAAADPVLETTAVQTVGIKGWDGFSISVVSG
ncbi:MAG TPA: O-methyltransferase [Burkholderiaceae bacterium]|nr:O-methyltransferase [Burkholderiaceae bacterium]